MANGYPDDPDNAPTQYGSYSEPTQAASYGDATQAADYGAGGQAYSEYTEPNTAGYDAGYDSGYGADYGAPTEANPAPESQPWFRKPAALVAIGAVAALILALAIYGIVSLTGSSDKKDHQHPSNAPATTSAPVSTEAPAESPANTATEAPATEAPATEAPATEAPATEAPTTTG
ncbi:hypothetical protein, partial [Mycolicibacterium insubricum]|uniref:hypothetical protein n=1 Tax=Mycolicibacterium insubricum TaxID=444597 RepID=UPI0021F26738